MLSADRKYTWEVLFIIPKYLGEKVVREKLYRSLAIFQIQVCNTEHDKANILSAGRPGKFLTEFIPTEFGNATAVPNLLPFHFLLCKRVLKDQDVLLN